LNFIALLGWSSPEGKEIMTVREMSSQFAIDRLQSAGAVFDVVKLKWMNSQYLRALSDQDLWQAIQPWLSREGFELPQNSDWQNKSVQAFKIKMETFADAVELYRPLSDASFQVLPEADEVYAWDSTRAALEAWKAELQSLNQDYLTEEEFLKIQDEVKVKANVKGKNLFMPIRVAVIGKPHGTELKILVPLISKQSLIRRAELALAKCK
jgi:nondiscriminating glutamyl-tRNA synthetase